MHLLLPPSEAKAPGGRGRPLRGRLGEGPLGAARSTVLAALAELVAGEPDAAARALLLPRGPAGAALEADRRVLDAPTTAALRRYRGVVYEGLDLAGLDAAEQRLAARSCHVFSGLFGVLRGDEPVPDYRVPAKAALPGIGIAGTFWRPVLAEQLPAILRGGLVVDLRSADYAAMWRPRGELAERVVPVRVLSPVPRGGRGVISHTSKLSKGRLAAALLRRAARGEPVEEAGDVLDTWRDLGGAGGTRHSARELELYTG